MASSESRTQRTNVAAPSLLAVANDGFVRDSNAQLQHVARTSSLLSSVVTKLRHSDIPSAPLLTLKLSSPSFLDCLVTDERNEELLYSIKTVGRSTSIKSTDSRLGTDTNLSTADIKWPTAAGPRDNRASDGVEIQLRGARWLGSGKLLRHGTGPLQGSTRKFNLPNYSHTLTWKRVRTSYWCVTPVMKGPIAIFEPSIASVPATISVYETLQDKHDTRPKPSHRGVPLGLLDYLLVTSLFLVTDVFEWIAVEKAKGKPITVPPIDGNGKITIVRSTPYLTSTSAEQWRRATLSEEFNQGAPSSSASVHGTSASSSSLMSTDEVLATMHLRDQAQSPSSTHSSSIVEDSDDYMFISSGQARRQFRRSSVSPASSAPPHIYLDPSFYNETPKSPVTEPYIPDSGRTPQPSPYRPSPPTAHPQSSPRQARALPRPPRPPMTRATLNPQPLADACLCPSPPNNTLQGSSQGLPSQQSSICGHCGGTKDRSISQDVSRQRSFSSPGMILRHRQSIRSELAPPDYNSIDFDERAERSSLSSRRSTYMKSVVEDDSYMMSG